MVGWVQRIKNELARDLDEKLAKELTLTSTTNFLVVYTKLSGSIYKQVDSHRRINQGKGRFIKFICERAKIYYVQNLWTFSKPFEKYFRETRL